MSWCRSLVALALLSASSAGVPVAAPAHAWPARPDAPASASGPTIVSLLATEQSALHVIRSIAVDVDRDGDLDLVASTLEQPVVVWLRDAVGRFERQRPERPAALAGDHHVGSPIDDAGVPPATGTPRSRDLADLSARVDSASVTARHCCLEKTPGVFSLTAHSRHTRGPPLAHLG